MAPNTNDNTPVITLDNYEEFFLMYVDEELTAQEKAMVEAFVQFHPELKSELDLLADTRLSPEPVSFGAIDSLLAPQMAGGADETLLLHVDGELDTTRSRAVEARLAADEAYRREHQLLLRTKSDPAELVPHPNKKELYRHSVVRMRFGAALRIAAAVLLIASMGVLLVQQQSGNTGTGAVAVAKPATQGEAPVASTPSGDAKAEAASPVQPVAEKAAVSAETMLLADAASRQVKKATAKQQAVVAEKAIDEMAATPVAEDLVAYEAVTVPQVDSREAQTISASRNNVDPTVTSEPRESYNITEPVFADNREKGNFKSLLRKATRMVERRTGINAANSDDEVLIGMVALKLK